MDPVETLSVPRTTSGVREAIEAFDDFARLHDVSRGAVWRIQLALDEILSNIVRHARSDDDGGIEMRLSVDGEGAVRVEVMDAAEAFNPLLVPAPDTAGPLTARSAGGLGIALVRSLMDETRYERRQDRNYFIMRCGPRADR